MAEQREIIDIETSFTRLDKVAAEHSRAAEFLPKLEQAIPAKAFRSELVPQDPNDQPAATLLTRIRAERKAAETQPKSHRMSGKAKTKLPKESCPALFHCRLIGTLPFEVASGGEAG